MVLRNNFGCYVIGALTMLLCGCETTKNIDEKYLIINDIAITNSEENVLTLKIQGDYAESAWGIKNLKHETIGDTIVLSGTLVSEGQGAFEYNIDIPPHVDSVKINNRILWTRPETL